MARLSHEPPLALGILVLLVCFQCCRLTLCPPLPGRCTHWSFVDNNCLFVCLFFLSVPQYLHCHLDSPGCVPGDLLRTASSTCPPNPSEVRTPTLASCVVSSQPTLQWWLHLWKDMINVCLPHVMRVWGNVCSHLCICGTEYRTFRCSVNVCWMKK